MEKRKGICTNYDGCSKAANDEIQEIDALDDFVCKECKHELEEVRERKKKGMNPKMMIAIGAVALVAIIVGLVFAFSGKNEEEIIEPIIVAEDSTKVETPDAQANRVDTLVIRVEGQENLPQEEEAVVEEEVVTEPAAPVVEETPATTPVAPSKPKTSSTGTHQLSYGSWTGGWKNGQPHGTGTLTYTTSHTIDSRDSKGRMAQPGEYVVGEWDNGHLVQGRWFKKDGTKEAIIIGKAG